MYNKKNVDFSYRLWEDFIYQVEYKDAKKSNEMYFPCFTKVVINFFMTKDQSIPRKNKYAIASGAKPPKTKASVRKKQSRSNTIMPPLTAKGKRLKTSAKVDKPVKEKQPVKTSKAKDEGTGIIPGVLDVPTYESDDEEIFWKSSEEKDDDEVNVSEHDEDIDDQSDFSTHDDEEKAEESFDPIVRTPSHDEKTDDEDNEEDSHGMNVEGDEMDDEGANKEDDADELYRDVNINLEGQQQGSSVSYRFISNMLNQSPDIGIDSIFNLNTESTPRTEKTVNEQLKVKVLTRSSNSSKTSHVVAANIFKLELKKILIEKMESNKSIHISDKQKNVYKDLVDAYRCDKIILDTYGDTVTLKRCQDNKDKDEEPSDGSNRGSNRRRARIEPQSTSAPKEKDLQDNWQGRKRQQFYGFTVNMESAQDIYYKRRIIAVIELQIVEWHNYKHLDWITIRRDDDKLYKFKEGDFKRLRIQDIKDMVLLLVQGKLNNLTIDECLAFNVSLRIFTRSIIIQ
uniref:Uncharacterized protein n=1 Tax=Tanacetum cinerariifolium TaxID=118510 RepID=A0A699HQ64_TANCI|nr:hypothetical protein [Tanacetum cinerariifolium]